MICNGIKARDFRNIVFADVAFSDGINVLYGDNAQGKTNLLEAIYYMAIGKSFRGAKAAEMVRFGCDMFELSIDFSDSVRRRNLCMRLSAGGKRAATENGCRVESLSSLVGTFRAVLFCPEHLLLVKEGPALRRNFLDVAICQLRPMYLCALQRYNRILKERNALLKHAEDDMRTFRETIEYWSTALAAEAAVIASTRLSYIKETDGVARDCFSDMTSGNETPSFHYMGTAHLDEDAYVDEVLVRRKFTELLLSHHDREIAAGTTLWGTHRDDIEILLNGKPARVYASQGQQRSIALAMKLAEGEISRRFTTEYPVFLFDDVLSELDEGRRSYLLSRITDRQVIMTSCERVRADNARIIAVRGGEYGSD